MKKIILILALLLLTSCNKYIVQNIYEKSYVTEEQATIDIYNQLLLYSISPDSVPLNTWIENTIKNDTIFVEQKMIRKVVNEKSNYVFRLSKYTYPSGINYDFLIRFSGKEKDLK